MNKRYNVYNVSRAAIFRLRKESRNLKIAALFVLSVFAAVHWNAVWSQSLSIEEIKRRITPAHEILLEYEKLKFDMTPAGIKAAEERAAEEARLAAERVERERREAEARRIAEEERRAAEVKAAAERAERERREAEEKRKAKREEMEKGAVEFGEAYIKRRGFDNSRDMAHFGSAILREELKQAVVRLRNATQFEDKDPLQQAVEAVRMKIGQERAVIAQEKFYRFYPYGSYSQFGGMAWSKDKLVVDLPNDKASFTMLIHSSVPFSIVNQDRKVKQEIVKEISFPVVGITANSAELRSTYGISTLGIAVYVTGNVAGIQEMWENGNNYTVKVLFNNFRHNAAIPSDKDYLHAVGGFIVQSGTLADVLAIDIIKR